MSKIPKHVREKAEDYIENHINIEGLNESLAYPFVQMDFYSFQKGCELGGNDSYVAGFQSRDKEVQELVEALKTVHKGLRQFYLTRDKYAETNKALAEFIIQALEKHRSKK